MLTLGMGAVPPFAAAQRADKLPRVALVFNSVSVVEMAGPDPVDGFARSFVHALRDLGYVEGRNIVIERRSAEGRPERMPALMKELIALEVDVIVAAGPAAIAAQRATETIPIVALIDEPDGIGLAASLARPGGNVTGVTSYPGLAMYGKLLQLLNEASPKSTRVAVIDYESSARQNAHDLHECWRCGVMPMARTPGIDSNRHRFLGVLESTADGHRRLFPRPAGPDDRPAPSVGGAGHAAALGRDRSLAGPSARAQGSQRPAWSQDADLFGPTAQLAGAGVSNAGRPRLPLRLMVALLYLKHGFNLSDEELVERWSENVRLAVLQRHGVLRAAPAVRRHADRSLSPRAG